MCIDLEYDSKIKPSKKRTSRFRRGSIVLCLILSPGERAGQFVNMLKEENLLSNKKENQKFLINAAPALELIYKDKTYPVYVCDSEKGVTVSLAWDRDKELSTLYSDPKMLSNVFDETFISKASGIKPDFKQLIGVALGGFVFGGIMGLLF